MLFCNIDLLDENFECKRGQYAVSYTHLDVYKRQVLDGGFLRFAPVGGVDPRMLLGGEVTILADKPLYGVV